jgi:hypothetical protein
MSTTNAVQAPASAVSPTSSSTHLQSVSSNSSINIAGATSTPVATQTAPVASQPAPTATQPAAAVAATPSTNSASSIPPSKFSKSEIAREWWWEGLTWFIGTCSILTLFLPLYYYNGKPVSLWKSRVSLNAIVAILSQMAQSMLLVSIASSISQLKWRWIYTTRPLTDLDLLDRASRGPEGSIVLLFKFIFQRCEM